MQRFDRQDIMKIIVITLQTAFGKYLHFQSDLVQPPHGVGFIHPHLLPSTCAVAYDKHRFF
jgi:hypothetical protein